MPDITLSRSTVQKFGRNPNMQAGDTKDIWEGPTDEYNWMDTASILYMASDNAVDTQKVLLTGLDSNWKEYIETVTLNGLSPVATQGTFMRVNRVQNAGANDFAGEITVASSDAHTLGVPNDGLSVRANVTLQHNQTLMAIYTVPDNGPAEYLLNWSWSIGNSAAGAAAKEADFLLYFRPFGGVFLIQEHITARNDGASPASLDFFGRHVEPRTDIKVVGNSSQNSTILSSHFVIYR